MVEITKITVWLMYVVIFIAMAVEYKELIQQENYFGIVMSTIIIVGVGLLGYYQGKKK